MDENKQDFKYLLFIGLLFIGMFALLVISTTNSNSKNKYLIVSESKINSMSIENKISLFEKQYLDKIYRGNISFEDDNSTDIDYDYKANITFKAENNGSEKLTFNEAYNNISLILKQIQLNTKNLSNVSISVIYPIKDSNGNKKDELIIKYNMDRKTIDMCSFNTLDIDNIRTLMDEKSYEHPYVSEVLDK